MSTQTRQKAPPAPAPGEQPKVLRIHFVVPAADGPIVSDPKDNPGLAEVVGLKETRRYVVACNPGQVFDDYNRGTSEPWAVRCKACVETEIFRQLKRPKPGRIVPDRSEEVDNGCCG